MHESSPIRSAQFSEKLQDLKGTSDDWTLSEDSKLCSVLEEMEKSLMARVDTAMQKLHAGDAAATRAAVNVANLNARLALFATDQFIESRVYDEPCVTYTEPPRSVKKIEQRQEETVENMREAVSLGFAMIRSHFKRIEMRPEDFDEDDDPTFIPDPVFEPFDPHLSRALPFLIGTNDWGASSSAGVRDSPVEFTKLEKDEVIIGLPAFVQPHIHAAKDVASPCAQLVQSQSVITTDAAMDGMERAPARMESSTDSRRSDHSGLFGYVSTDEEGAADDDLFFAYNEEPAPRGVAAEAYLPRETSRLKAEKQAGIEQEYEPNLKQNFLPRMPSGSPVTTGSACIQSGSDYPIVHNESKSTRHSAAVCTGLSQTSSMNLFITKDALFGDSDSDGDIFADASIRKTKCASVTPHNDPSSEEKSTAVKRGSSGVIANPPSVVSAYSNVLQHKASTTLSGNLFDDDSDEDDLFANPKSHPGEHASCTDNPKQMSSEKAVFRSNGRLPPNFASRLSGLIVAPPKHPSASQSRSVSSEGIHSKQEPSDFTAGEADQFLNIATTSGKSAVRVGTLTEGHNLEGSSDISTLPSLVKSRIKGPGRRAPTRTRVTMAVNQEPEEIFQNSNDTNDRVSLPNAVTAVTDAPVVEHDALRDATAKVSDANSVGRLITRTIASKQQPSSLFSDSDDDIFLPATTSVQSGQKPHVQPAATQQNDGAAAVVRRGSDARGEQHSNGDRATEKESNVGTDALTTATANVASQPKAGSAGAVTKTTNSRPVGLIFATDDEDDDDIFATSSSVNRSTSTFQCRNRSSKANSATLPIKAAVPSESTAVPNKRGIFDDDSDSDNDIFR